MKRKPKRVFYLFLFFVLITIALYTHYHRRDVPGGISLGSPGSAMEVRDPLGFDTKLSQNPTNVVQVRQIVKQNRDDDISCYYDYSKDNLPSAEDMVFGKDSIFFHETSCRGALTSRQACVVESAARLHPNRSVYVLFSASLTEEDLQRSCLIVLRELNVKFLRIHLPEYAEGTGLEDILMKQINKASGWRIEHSADILRFITLYKYGGVYLDMDVLVVKQLDALGKNWAVRETNDTINNAAMAATEDGIGHKVFETILEGIRKDYRPYAWSYNGPGAITRTLQKYCDNDTNIGNFSAENCQGFEVYDPSILYPIPYPAFKFFFEPGSIGRYNESYGLHFWNRLSRKWAIIKGSLIHDLATKYCPSIVNYFEDDFGSALD